MVRAKINPNSLIQHSLNLTVLHSESAHTHSLFKRMDGFQLPVQLYVLPYYFLDHITCKVNSGAAEMS